MAKYDYFAPYIERCRQGETSALFGPSQHIIMFAMTSGTTAAAKYIPVTTATAAAYRRGWHIWGIKAISDHYSPYRLRRILQVTSPHDEHHTPAGTPCGAISGLLAANQKPIVRRLYATGPAVAYIPDPTARYYTIMRLAICHDVGFISTANPSTTITLARTADQHAATLIADIHDGTLSDSIPVPNNIRQTLAPLLHASPTRAAQLEHLLNQHDHLLPRHYWQLGFLANWIGGSLSLYLRQLAEYYGPTPVRDIGLLASEGRMTIPLADNTPAGVLDITANFYEFVPTDQIENSPPDPNSPTLAANLDTLTADQLQIGSTYYIFLTNHSGLYRYHIGDIVRVTDFVGTTPVLEFLSRGSYTSSITGEKLTEDQTVNAASAAATELNLQIETFVIAPTFANPPHYQLSVQLPRPATPEQLAQLATRIDHHLCTANIEYASKRHSLRLAPIAIRQTPPDFLTTRDQQLKTANPGRAEQFKHRFLYNQPLDLPLV